MANPLGELFTNIANSIRGGLSDVGKMSPSAFPSKIDEIVGMIGESTEEIDDILDAINGEVIGETLYTVTFKSYDGSETYGAIQVVENDNCPDPVTTNVFGKPQRESTAQYDFNHIGWSRTAEGEREYGVLSGITSDITLYAAFSSTVRYYTITFYDDTSVWKEVALPYGSTPTISTPEKYGWLFDKWQPAITTVTGDASYYAKWLQGSFSAASWSDIGAICKQGKASEYFNVGEEKVITLDGQDIALKIAGFNHDLLMDDSKASMTIVLSTVFDQELIFNDSGTADKEVFWPQSILQETIDELYYKLPYDLYFLIESAKKYYRNGYSGGGFYYKELWPLTYEELGIANDFGETYELFKEKGKRVLTKFNSTTGVPYYTRTSNGGLQWMVVKADGSTGSINKGEAAYLHFGFCIK